MLTGHSAEEQRIKAEHLLESDWGQSWHFGIFA